MENLLLQKFQPPADITRVITSWRSLDAGIELDRPFGSVDWNSDPYLRQRARSFLTGLTVKSFWDDSSELFPWATELEENYDTIREEFERVTKDRKGLEGKGNNVWARAADSDSAAR